MIDRIKGVILDKNPTGVVIDIGGIALALAAPLTTVEKLSRSGEEAVLYTHLYVREDSLDLFGFLTAADRDLFRLLLKISGIGPKTALALLSRFSPPELAEAVADGDIRRLSSVPGIGPKTAERLLVELKNRFKPLTGIVTEIPEAIRSNLSEAIRALETLGFAAAKAEAAIRKARQKLGDGAKVEELVKNALKEG